MRKSINLPGFPWVAALCFVLAPMPAFSQISDDFSSLELDPATWSLVDPADNSSSELLNGWLTLGIPAGPGHDIRQGMNRSARLVQAVSVTDFEIEAKFQSLPTEDFQAQGLLVENDATHFLHLDFRRAGPDRKLSCATVNGGITKIQGEMDLEATGPLWLRLGRVGNTWSMLYSLDGESWTTAFTFDHVMTVLNVGIFGANAGKTSGDSDLERDDPVGDKNLDASPAPAFDVMVDYFFDTANPIDPEDGDIQNGVRVTDELQALYLFSAGSGDIVFDYSTALPKLDLAIPDTNTAVWLPGGGMDLTAASLISSAGPAEKIIDACLASSEISMEAWVDPVTTVQSGPARILTVSADPSNRNATLAHGQWGSLPSDVFDARLRTTETSVNGQPETVSPAGSMTGDLQHVVYTRDVMGNARIYVDGAETVVENIGGTLDNWDASYRLGIGAEMDGTRFWLGEIHLAAVYSRALTDREVEINFGAGPAGGLLTDSPPVITLHGLSPGQEFGFDDPVNLSAVAGDADGFVTQVEFFADDVLLATDTAAPYEFAWTNPAVGSHQIRAVATDDQGQQTVSEVIPILVTVPLSFRSVLFLSDDFFDADLGQPWAVADGTAGASVNQTGGHVIVDLPAVTQDPWSAGAQVFHAHQPEADVDVALELKLATTDFGGDAFGGLRFEGAGGETVQLLGEFAGGNWTVGWGSSSGGIFSDLGSVSVPTVVDGLWLQVRRQAATFTCLYSTDGYLWQPAATLTRTMVLDRCGWVAGGLDSAGGAQTVACDYAFNLAAPIHPEDGGSGGDYTGPVIGEVAVVTALDQASLSWQTDEPAFYRVAYGLTTGYEMGL
ncbi:MAG: LamG-like jellyroll fold domain-containing protein, partial [Candidatus Krumholzibacteriota bacterium]